MLGITNFEKIETAGTKHTSAVKKYINTLMVLSKLYFLAITEKMAKIRAPQIAIASPERLVKLKLAIFPLVVIMIMPIRKIYTFLLKYRHLYCGTAYILRFSHCAFLLQ